MSVSVSVESPRKFTKETLIFVGGGALSGLIASGLHLIAGETIPALAALAFGGIVGLLANLTDPRAGTPMLRLVLAILGGASLAILLNVQWILAAAVAGVFLGIAFSLEDGDNAVEKGFFAVLYAVAMVAGLFVTSNVGAQIDVGLAQSVFAGSTWGVFLAFAGGLKRLKWTRDELRAEFNDAHAELQGDERETIRAGRVIYDQIVRELERTPDRATRDRAVEIATETSRALIAITRRAQQLRQGAERTASRRLQGRIVELDERIEATRDATVRRELEATLEELVEQVKVRKRFDVAAARLEARQQRCFTALERLHVSLVQSTSGADDVAVRESIESLEKLSDEIRWRNLSVDELVSDGEPSSSSEEDVDDIVAEIRAELDSRSRDAEQSDDEDEVVLGGSEQTVFDTASDSAPEASADPPGTDGSVSATQSANASVRSES